MCNLPIRNHQTKVQPENNRYVRKCTHDFIFIYESKHLNFFAFAVKVVLLFLSVKRNESFLQAMTPPDHMDNIEVTLLHLLQFCS